MHDFNFYHSYIKNCTFEYNLIFLLLTTSRFINIKYENFEPILTYESNYIFSVGPIRPRFFYESINPIPRPFIIFIN
jgi:hypothetical protein